MSPSQSSPARLLFALLLVVSAGANCSATRSKQPTGHLIDPSENRQQQQQQQLVEASLFRAAPFQDGPNFSLGRYRRQSEGGGGGLGSIGITLGLACPNKSSDGAETPEMRAEILLHRSSHRDDISIAESNSEAQFELSVERLLDSAGFQRDKPTLIYLAGWMQTAQSNWLQQARKTLDDLVATGGGGGGGGASTAAPVNLMIVDYAAYNSLSFARTVSMVPHIGQVLANFLQQLVDKRAYSANKIHIVSYSLSAHIAGVAGRLLKDSGRGQLAQITAIDPTGVCFHKAENAPFDADFGLKPADAKLVLARHYNMHGFGAGRPIGGVDVFVNGGERQPRMDIQDWNPLEVLGSTSVMAWAGHHRAIQHEAASSGAHKPGDCHEIAYKCASFLKFKRGQCADCGQRNENCLLVSTLGSYSLGIEQPHEINYANGTQMHIMTGVKHFCTYNYQVLARLKRRPPVPVLSTFERGQARFELAPGVSVAPVHKLNATSQWDASGGPVSFTALLRLETNQLERLPQKVGCPTVELFDWIDVLEVNFMGSISAAERRNKSARYCPDERDELKLVKCR